VDHPGAAGRRVGARGLQGFGVKWGWCCSGFGPVFPENRLIFQKSLLKLLRLFSIGSTP
jgi:hypothetical protein